MGVRAMVVGELGQRKEVAVVVENVYGQSLDGMLTAFEAEELAKQLRDAARQVRASVVKR